jgi:hypothetical protein
MALETGVEYPDDLVVTNPEAGDSRREGDDHIRLTKTALVNYSKDFDGNPADAPILEKLFPAVGIAAIVTGPVGNPGNQIGGTWTLWGTITVNLTGGGTTDAYLWYRAS